MYVSLFSVDLLNFWTTPLLLKSTYNSEGNVLAICVYNTLDLFICLLSCFLNLSVCLSGTTSCSGCFLNQCSPRRDTLALVIKHYMKTNVTLGVNNNVVTQRTVIKSKHCWRQSKKGLETSLGNRTKVA